MDKNKLTPFGQAVLADMTTLEVERELLPDMYPCMRDCVDDICEAWGMSRGELEQLELVATMKFAERQAKVAA